MASLIGTQTSEKTFKKGKRGKGRVDGSNEKGKGRDEMGIEQRLDAERVALLAEKQAEMEKVVDSHDTLVSYRVLANLLSLNMIQIAGARILPAGEVRHYAAL